ncbi:deaminase [uncultured Phenylobacterium sp.]|uniref:deaminase n=1 Tax=uncultured Phenylobacterium sp. TaxID=349273 RepID=UPI0025F6C994|nr:deaminase [uncultured Phenylobacterium sp.]
MSPDEDHMRRAISLAATRVGLTGDNPSVGCVLVREGAVVGEGVTGEGGRPHAEEAALAAAGDGARGATAYVTLEPCGERSSGTPSCSDRLADAGVVRVVVACADPSVFAAGRGAHRLQAAGVAIDQGLLQAEAAPLYAQYAPAKSLESRR